MSPRLKIVLIVSGIILFILVLTLVLLQLSGQAAIQNTASSNPGLNPTLAPVLPAAVDRTLPEVSIKNWVVTPAIIPVRESVKVYTVRSIKTEDLTHIAKA